MSPAAQEILRRRYLLPVPEGGLEEPGQMFRRVAGNLAQVERRWTPDLAVEPMADSFFRLMACGDFLPNAPTLLGAGGPSQQLCACFVLPVEDSIEGVFRAVGWAARVHSQGGGTGFSFSRLRSRGTPVSSGGLSTGPVPFLKVFDAETEVLKGGGTGWGANMGVLSCHHPDVLEFIEAKSRGALVNFNLSVAVTDAFMEALARGGEVDLSDPHTGQAVRRLPAAQIFEALCRQAWATGEPGLLFIDRINRDNPTPDLGTIEATNPCGEAPLLPFEACCLGGLNVARCLGSPLEGGRQEGADLDWERLARTAALAVRMMDNVVEAGRYPLPEIEQASRRTRKLGIGVMGFADLLIERGIPYDSTEAESLARQLMGCIRQATQEASQELARERGSFPAWSGSGGRRNATTTSNAPNSTISVVAGCSAGIEPLYSIALTRNLRDGTRLSELHPAFEGHARRLGLDPAALLPELGRSGGLEHLAHLPQELRQRFRTALEISPEWHVRLQAAFQEHTELGISKTINLRREAPLAQVEEAFLLAHRLGCKGVTVFRDGCRTQQFLCPQCPEGDP